MEIYVIFYCTVPGNTCISRIVYFHSSIAKLRLDYLKAARQYIALVKSSNHYVFNTCLANIPTLYPLKQPETLQKTFCQKCFKESDSCLQIISLR